jgi:hypothetical protein
MYTLTQIQSGLHRSIPPRVLTPGQKGAITGLLNQVCGSDRARRIVLAWCFPETFNGRTAADVTSKDLSDAQWYALLRWVNYTKTFTGEYAYHAGLDEECAAILTIQAPLMGEMEIRRTGSSEPSVSQSSFLPA